MNAIRNFWRWLMTLNLAPGWVVLREADYAAMQTRIALYERRAKAAREGRANRQPKEIAS